MKRLVLTASALAVATALSTATAFADHTPVHSAVQNNGLINVKKAMKRLELERLRVPCPRCPPPPCLSCPQVDRIGPAVRGMR
jgi:hypothetical protein